MTIASTNGFTIFDNADAIVRSAIARPSKLLSTDRADGNAFISCIRTNFAPFIQLSFNRL
ncbi:MAG: hypothetical protein ACRC2R_04105 [Xenococcaceae cyanobacterium]